MDLFRFEEYYEIINHNISIADILSTFFSSCPNFPNEYTYDDVDILRENFCRGTKRAMYFARNYINELEKIEEQIERIAPLSIDSTSMAHIEDNIFFEFDAFVFSCKSILEENMLKRAEKLNPIIKSDYLKYSKNVYDKFIKNYLAPLRNEIAHLNNSGSSSASTVRVKNGKSEILSFKNFGGLDLREVFEKIFININQIIRDITSFLIHHECLKFGFPDKNIGFSTKSNGIIKIKDIINFDMEIAKK